MLLVVITSYSIHYTKLYDTFDELHCVGGGGLRFQVLPNDGLNFRIDYGVSNHNESGVFFTIREAF